MDSTVEYILRRHGDAKALRGNWETIWQDIADRVLPQAGDFTTIRSDGERRTELMFDATPALALQKFAAAIESFLTPRNQRWHMVTVSDPYLAKEHSVRAWLDEVTDTMFRARYSPKAAFASQTNEVYLGLGAFGTSGLFIDDDVRNAAVRYKSLNLAQTFILENQHGRVDTLFRCFKWTLRQIAQRWGAEKLPDKLRQRLEMHPDEKHEVLHYVGPREDYATDLIGALSMPWRSCYLLPHEKHKLEEGGYRVWPFGISRYMTTADEVYGRSPAWMALSNIRVLNSQKKSILKAAQKVIDPPLLASEDGVLSAFSQVPGAVNFGGLDSSGNQLVKPLITNAKIDIGLDMMDKEREIIASGFLLDVFQTLVENPQMTATQALELISERASLVSPILGRQQGEFLGSVTEREIDILANAGQLPPMPPEMIEAGGEYEIEYTSPMSRAVRASDGVAIVRTLEGLTPLAQIDPSVLDVFDTEMVARELSEINGVPAKVLRSPEAIKAMKEGRAQQAEAAALLEAAPSVTSAAANLVKLQANLGRPTL